MRNPLLVTLAASCVLLIAACTTESYETGDGKYSYLRADFVDAHSGEAKKVMSARTDDGDSLVFRGGATCEWVTTPDSVYRGLLYSSRNGDTEAPYADFLSMSQVMVLRMPEKKPAEMYTDPLTLESAWVGANGKYLNLGLYVKTGVPADTEKKLKQVLGVSCDTIVTHDDGHREFHLILYHDQHGVPEYYSSCIYASIPIGHLRAGDIVNLDVNTYEGLVRHSFVK